LIVIPSLFEKVVADAPEGALSATPASTSSAGSNSRRRDTLVRSIMPPSLVPAPTPSTARVPFG
jgi:hypothetical protein